MQNKQVMVFGVVVLALAAALSFFYFSRQDNAAVVNPSTTSITYENTTYGFTFSLPATWKGYSIIQDTWRGDPIVTDIAQETGPKLLIRNPKWTSAAPYEDLPILVFTLNQWNLYKTNAFSVSAAPIPASELGRNDTYVFALPPRWDFDYSLGYQEAEDIMAANPLHPLSSAAVNGKLNINVVCEQALSYMTFPDAQSADTFVADCKEGKHPEVIEKYKSDMNLGNGAQI